MVTNVENPNELQENLFKPELKELERNVTSYSNDDGKWLERPSVPREMRRVLEKYEEKTNLSDEEFKTYMEYINRYNTRTYLHKLTKITDYQAAEIVKNSKSLILGNLTSITDKQAELLGKASYIELNGLRNITDKQAELLSKVKYLKLNGLRNITDKQAELLSKYTDTLELSGLSHITNKQAELFSKLEHLNLNGLISITDEQAEQLSNVKCLGINKNIVTPRQKRIILDKKDYLINTTEDGSGGYIRREYETR